jgi:hypothetical protein
MAKRVFARLERREAFKEPKRTFFIFSEGKNTEPEYLRAIHNLYPKAIIAIEVEPAAGAPQTIERKAIAKKKEISERAEEDSFSKNDQVWAVFDRDEHDKYLQSVNNCESNGIGVARSNPCFELWLILHEGDYDKACTRQQVQVDLGKVRKEYNRKSGKLPDCKEMVARVEAAEKRAAKQIQRREADGNPHGAPSTTFGELTKAIREAVNEWKKQQ